MVCVLVVGIRSGRADRLDFIAREHTYEVADRSFRREAFDRLRERLFFTLPTLQHLVRVLGEPDALVVCSHVYTDVYVWHESFATFAQIPVMAPILPFKNRGGSYIPTSEQLPASPRTSMSDTEKKIADTRGQYLQAVQGGRELNDASWTACRIVLTTQRLVLIADGKRQIPLQSIDRIADRHDVNQQSASVSNYVALHVDEDVVLVSAGEHEEFETNLYRAALNGEIILVQHPAVEGGVVQDSEWTKGRMKVTDEALRLALADGQAVEVERADIGDLAIEDKTVSGEERTVIEVEHTDEGISVETHLAGGEFHATVLQVMLEESAERNRADLDLSSTERRVIMALHSGVSPFDIPSFVGIDVEQTEEIFDRLIELDVISVVRERTEVQLTTKGRRTAGENISEQ